MQIKKIIIVSFFVFAIFSCKKNSTAIDTKTGFSSAGGKYIANNKSYPISQVINSDNTTRQIDSLSGNPPNSIPGIYSYSNDSIFIVFNNSTKYNLRFSNNYICYSGTGFYIDGFTGPVTMTKNNTINAFKATEHSYHILLLIVKSYFQI